MRFLKLLLNTLFPPVCVSCKKEGDFLCLDCLKSLSKKKIKSHYQKVPDPDFRHLDGVIYALDYAKNPQIKAAIKQFKYRFTQDLADHFANLIVEKIGELNMAKRKRIILIPVPLHKKRLNYRGFNQAEMIANAVQRKLPKEKAKVIEMLKRIRHTKQQAKLDKEGRHENLEGAFKLNKFCVQEYNPKNLYFIVDDVCTTGTTLEHCTKALKENGFEKVYGLVIARALKTIQRHNDVTT